MKKIILFFIVTITGLSLFSSQVTANEQTDIYIAPYLNNNDLSIIFDNTTQVLDYLEGDYLEQPIALFIADSSQFTVLKSKGIRPELISENANLAEFVYLYNRSPNKGAVLAEYGEVYVISPHHTLLKLNDTGTFSLSGELVAFSPMPLGQTVEKPPSISVTIPEEMNITGQNPILKFINENKVLVVSLIFIILVAAGILVWRIWRKRTSQSVTDI